MGAGWDPGAGFLPTKPSLGRRQRNRRAVLEGAVSSARGCGPRSGDVSGPRSWVGAGGMSVTGIEWRRARDAGEHTTMPSAAPAAGRGLAPKSVVDLGQSAKAEKS